MFYDYPTAALGKLTGHAPDVILVTRRSFQLLSLVYVLLVFVVSSVLEVRDLGLRCLLIRGQSPSSQWFGYFLDGAPAVPLRLNCCRFGGGCPALCSDRGAHKTAWLPNGPDLALFAPRQLPLDRSVFTVLYAGAYGDANALENVIAAARYLRHLEPRVVVHLVGDGPEKQSLMNLAADLNNVIFEAPVPKSQIPDLMAEADAILLSLRDVPLFRYGVSPNKLYDAYALGRPVITTAAGSINAEVEEHRLGVTAPPGDPKALASAIKTLVNTPRTERQAMAARAKELAQTTYSRQRINAIQHLAPWSAQFMMIAVSGANGFTGRFVCAELKRRHLPFTALLRPGTDSSWMDARQIPVRFADLNQKKQLAGPLIGCDALLNVASIGFGAASPIIDACRLAGVSRAVFVSTTAIFTKLNAVSKEIRLRAESVITSSGLDTTILRPTMIYGTPGDRNMIRLIRWLYHWPVFPCLVMVSRFSSPFM